MSLGDLYERRGAWPRDANTLHNGFAIAGLRDASSALRLSGDWPVTLTHRSEGDRGRP